MPPESARLQPESDLSPPLLTTRSAASLASPVSGKIAPYSVCAIALSASNPPSIAMNQPPDEDQLCERFDHWFHAIYPNLRSTLKARSIEDAQDILLVAAAKLWDVTKRERKLPERGVAIVIVRHIAIDWYRKMPNTHELTVTPNDTGESYAELWEKKLSVSDKGSGFWGYTAQDDPAGSAEWNDLLARLDAVIQRLSEEERIVILLRDFHGLAWKAIGHEIKQSAYDAKQLHIEAFKKLQRLIDPNTP